MTITSEEQLRELYGWPQGRAKIKVLPALEKHAENFIKHSPFLVMSTYDKNGRSDASPRGGSPGFVHIQNENTLILPDAKGNNRVDSLVNITETGKIGLLFLIPGINETLRINGTAEIRNDHELIEIFSDLKNTPTSCLVINVEESFLHCAKAFMRSKLWSADSQISRGDFPSMGKMLNEQLGTNKKEETQKEMEERYNPDL